MRKRIINNSDIPQHVIDSIARCLWPDILASYMNENERREIEAWAKKRDINTDEKGR